MNPIIARNKEKKKKQRKIAIILFTIAGVGYFIAMISANYFEKGSARTTIFIIGWSLIAIVGFYSTTKSISKLISYFRK